MVLNVRSAPKQCALGLFRANPSARGDTLGQYSRFLFERLAVSTDAQRAELHRTIWQIANDLRGSVDGWDFKAYVLGFLFYRFISENLTDFINEGEAESGNTGFDYALLPDADAEDEEFRRDIVSEKGFFIRPSELFVNVRARAPHNENLNETLSMVFANIERSSYGTRTDAGTRGKPHCYREGRNLQR